MNESRDRQLFSEAADLAIRLQSDPTNPVSLRTAQAWVNRSPDHQAAWRRVAEIHGMTGKVLTRKPDALESISRRNFILAGAVGIGAIGAGSLTLPRLALRARADHVTATGEIRRIDLADGSTMTLGPDGAVALDFSGTRRGVELLAGMAYFQVSPDPSGPFSVRAGEVSATMLGRSFDVSSDAGFVSVAVEDGRVAVHTWASQAPQNETLVAGDWISLNPDGHVVERGTRETSQIASWRTGMIVAERETVAAMVAKIARWMPGQVIVADPSLGSRKVSGVFDLSDPPRALEAVTQPFGAHIRRVGSLVTVISPV